MKNLMSIHYVNGLNSDNVNVVISNGERVIFSENYAFGYNSSYNRKFARMAEIDHLNAIKYGWHYSYPLKPFIGDILNDLCKKYEIDKSEIHYSGRYIFCEKDYTEEEAQDLVKLFDDEDE